MGVPDPTGAPAAPPPTLVVGVDRRVESRVALQVAASLGRRLGARLEVVHAVDLGDAPVDPDGAWAEEVRAALAEERLLVSAVLDGYRPGWAYRTWRGDPADALAAAAEERGALLVVVGARSGARHAWDRRVTPSVSQRLVAHCHRPVLVVPVDQEERSGDRQ